MSSNLKTREIVEAAITVINDAVAASPVEIDFTPALVQEGDLAHWWEQKEDLSDDLPAIFVKAMEADIEVGADNISDSFAQNVGTITRLRIVLADSWGLGDVREDLRQDRTEQIAQAFITDQQLGGAVITNYTVFRSYPSKMEFEPPEHVLLSLDEERRLYATAVVIDVEGLSQPRTL